MEGSPSAFCAQSLMCASWPVLGSRPSWRHRWLAAGSSDAPRGIVCVRACRRALAGARPCRDVTRPIEAQSPTSWHVDVSGALGFIGGHDGPRSSTSAGGGGGMHLSRLVSPAASAFVGDVELHAMRCLHCVRWMCFCTLSRGSAHNNFMVKGGTLVVCVCAVGELHWVLGPWLPQQGCSEMGGSTGRGRSGRCEPFVLCVSAWGLRAGHRELGRSL